MKCQAIWCSWGIEGGWESRGGVRMGAALYDLLNGVPMRDHRRSSDAASPPETKLHFFGLWIGKHLPLGALGITGDVLLGVGDVSAYRGAKKNDFDRSWFFVAQPCIGLDFPKLGPLVMRFSVGYRLVSELSNGGTALAPLAGPMLQATASFVNL